MRQNGGLAPPQRPSVWAVGFTTLGGYIFGGVLLIVVGLSASAAIGFPNVPGRGAFYDVRGMRHQQRVPLADPPAVSCGRAAGR